MIYVGIDDTDNPQCGGTGRVARQLAAMLRAEFPVLGVSRHQFLVDPHVPYTSNNSGNVIHLLTDEAELSALADRLEGPLVALCLEGSDPGLCVARGAAAGHPFGPAAQRQVITQAGAFAAAREVGAVLRGLGGTRDGVIGAMAAVILAAGGNDGRFVDAGRVRELGDVVPVQEVLDAGVAEIRTADGLLVTAGEVDTLGGRVRPVMRGGQPVLLVEPAGDACWRVIEQGKHRAKRQEGAACHPS